MGKKKHKISADSGCLFFFIILFFLGGVAGVDWGAAFFWSLLLYVIFN
jgi:hypothetical protein